MTHQQIYLKAAERIYCGLNIYACSAISSAMQEANALYCERLYVRSLFSDLFKPSRPRRIWYGDVTSENQLARQLALLFMAEIAKDEGD